MLSARLSPTQEQYQSGMETRPSHRCENLGTWPNQSCFDSESSSFCHITNHTVFHSVPSCPKGAPHGRTRENGHNSQLKREIQSKQRPVQGFMTVPSTVRSESSHSLCACAVKNLPTSTCTIEGQKLTSPTQHAAGAHHPSATMFKNNTRRFKGT